MNSRSYTYTMNTSLTAREYFAGIALKHFLENTNDHQRGFFDMVAGDAADMADTLVDELNKREQEAKEKAMERYEAKLRREKYDTASSD